MMVMDLVAFVIGGIVGGGVGLLILRYLILRRP